MSVLLEAVQRALQEDGWPCQLLDDPPGLQAIYRGDHGQWVCQAEVFEDRDLLLFYSICPLLAPVERRGAMAECLTRANSAVLMGTLQMDFESGEICCRTSLDTNGGVPPAGEIRSLAYANVIMLDQYLPAIMAVASGAQSPAEAIAQAEAKIATAYSVAVE
jgi:hypothetical protein